VTRLQFAPIDLKVNSLPCLAFRRDSYVCSFDDGEERFSRENGQNGELYLSWLKDRIAEFPQGCVHAFLNGDIVGQLEMRLRNKELGYVNLFYLVDCYRGTSLSSELHSYTEKTMKAQGVSRVQLSVSPTNNRALKYYTKHGWKNLGVRGTEVDVFLMELSL
jgi:ribosomal protein S18 acetylase RimI-like enzyme